MLAFFTSKLGLYAIILVVLGLMIGGIVFELRYLEGQVQAAQQANTELTLANAGLSKNIAALQQQQMQIVQEFSLARASDNSATQAVQKTSALVVGKIQQMQRVRQAKPTVLIKLLNKNLTCEQLHFTEQGTCRNGIWQKLPA